MLVRLSPRSLRSCLKKVRKRMLRNGTYVVTMKLKKDLPTGFPFMAERSASTTGESKDNVTHVTDLTSRSIAKVKKLKGPYNSGCIAASRQPNFYLLRHLAAAAI